MVETGGRRHPGREVDCLETRDAENIWITG